MTGTDEPQRIDGPMLAAKVKAIAETATVTHAADYDDVDLFAEEREAGLDRMREGQWSRIIPPRFHDVDMTRFAEGVVTELDAWAQRPAGRNLVLLGPVGVGKTAAAVAACRPAHFAGLEVAFWPVVELLDALRPSGNDLALDVVAGVDRLIIDDVGSERPTDWTGERLYAIVNRRWLDKAPTIVTTNLEPDGLEETVGARMFSRLVGNDAVVLRLGGPDRRRKP